MRRSEREADKSPPFGAEVKNKISLISSLHGGHRYLFTFFAVKGTAADVSDSPQP
jgi:hypothetical protein